MKRITLKDVAKKAGVSFPTVSKVVNNYDSQVAPKTKDKVLKVINELNYRPDYNARSLRSGKKLSIGVALHSSMKQMYETNTARILAGIGSVVDRQKYYMTHIPMGDNFEESLVQVAQSKMVDGLIIQVYDSQYEKFISNIAPILLKENFPFTVVHFSQKDFPCPHAGYNIAQAGYLGTRHLMEQGYKEIGMICHQEKHTHGELYRGYMQALDEKGYTPHYLESGSTEYSARDGYAYGEKLLGRYGLLDGYVVYADSFAYGLMQVLHDQGIGVPEKTGVVGCNNLVRDEVFYQTLTVTDRKYEERGEKAAEMLFEAIENGGGKGKAWIAEPELIVRESSLKNC